MLLSEPGQWFKLILSCRFLQCLGRHSCGLLPWSGGCIVRLVGFTWWLFVSFLKLRSIYSFFLLRPVWLAWGHCWTESKMTPLACGPPLLCWNYWLFVLVMHFFISLINMASPPSAFQKPIVPPTSYQGSRIQLTPCLAWHDGVDVCTVGWFTPLIILMTSSLHSRELSAFCSLYSWSDWEDSLGALSL